MQSNRCQIVIRMHTTKTFQIPFNYLWLVLVAISLSSCGIYKFNDVSVDPNVKTVRITTFLNRANYVNPQLHPTLTDRVRQRIVNQTRLAQTNSDNAHYDITGVITNYSISTSGISTGGNNNQRQASLNNLNVTVHITLNDRLKGEVKEYDVSRAFPFNASLTFQAAEAQLLDEIVRNLSDDIFNRIFSTW